MNDHISLYLSLSIYGLKKNNNKKEEQNAFREVTFNLFLPTANEVFFLLCSRDNNRF